MTGGVFFRTFGEITKKEDCMLGYSYSTKDIRLILPLLKEHFAFDYVEISCELASVVNTHMKEKRLNKELLTKYSDDIALYGLHSDETITIPVSDDFEAKLEKLRSVCAMFCENKDVEDTYRVLSFISAIFYREKNRLSKEAFSDFEDEVTDAKIKDKIQLDLCRLYIALHDKPKLKNNSPIKICFKGDSPHEITNFDGWMFRLLDEHITKEVGNITLKEAKQQLTQVKEQKGRKSKSPYLNYIINGIYNFIHSFITDEKKLVTVEQCKFIREYLLAMDFINSNDKLYDTNHLQSTIKSLISSKSTPVQRHGQFI